MLVRPARQDTNNAAGTRVPDDHALETVCRLRDAGKIQRRPGGSGCGFNILFFGFERGAPAPPPPLLPCEPVIFLSRLLPFIVSAYAWWWNDDAQNAMLKSRANAVRNHLVIGETF
jgi:hypothetical protein